VSTASCGAAAIGCAYGRFDATAGLLRGRTDGAPSDPPTLPKIPLDSPSTQSELRSFRRPQSFSIPPSGPLWPGLHEEPTHDGSNPTDVEEAPIVTESHTVEAVEESPGFRKASWVRRMSAIPQSQDGSQPSSPPPSSPSHFSNAPFFPQVVTPRNKLVKRSTSLRVLHSGYDSSPLSITQTPTFRRPVTSYQRSEQLRRHQLQKDLENAEAEHLAGDEVNQTIAPPPHEASPLGPGQSDTTWQPYFLVQSIRLIRDFSRGSTFGKSSNAIENVPCIRTLPGSVPALVLASHVSKPTLISSPAGPRFLQRSPDEPEATQFDTEQSVDYPHKLPKSRHSFALGDIMSTPPSARKLRRGESLRKLRGVDATLGRRVVSAPLHESQPRSQYDPITEEDRPGSNPSGEGQHTRASAKQPTRISSSPLPPLQRLSAFEIELPEEEPSHPPTPDHFPSSSPLTSGQSPSDALDRAGYSSLRFKPRRSSRIPSDRASTAFSSENEQSRVFSTDGDDIDYRSETVYDSIRTDATSSSHSGAKVYRADSVFGGVSPEPPVSITLPIHDRGSNIPVPGSKVHDVRIAEEEEMGTPVRVQHLREVETPTPAPRVFHLTPPGGESQHLAAQPEAPPIDTVAEDTEAEDFWSVLEESNDRTETDVEVKHDDDWIASGTDNGRHVSPERREPAQPSTNVGGLNATDIGTDSHDRLPPFATERGSRSGRRAPLWLHLRSQSVPLPAENNGHRFNNAAKLDAWVLGGKGVSEDWDNDFEFDEPGDIIPADDSQSANTEKGLDLSGVLVPPSILDRQASVHGQFGQVKKLTQLVEELRDLRQSADKYGLVQGQSSELWREAEGIIDLATLDDDENDPLQPHSPQSSSIDFDAFEEEPSTLPRLQASGPPIFEALRSQEQSTSADTSVLSSSPFGSRHGTPQTRPRKESVAKAKHVLENIHQHRNFHDPRTVPEESSPRKLPFDTTSLRDLVTRAGVVTRALREIVRRAEDPNHTSTPDRIPQTPPEPAFSQIFQPSASSPSSRRSPRSAHRRSSGSVLSGSSGTNENDRNGHLPIMSVV
jgi:Septation protein etd1